MVVSLTEFVFETFNSADESCNSCHSVPALQFDLKILSILFRQNNAVKYGFALNGSEFIGLHGYFNEIVATCKFFPVHFSAESFIYLSKPLRGDILQKLEIYGTQSEKWITKLVEEYRCKPVAAEVWRKQGLEAAWITFRFCQSPRLNTAHFFFP